MWCLKRVGSRSGFVVLPILVMLLPVLVMAFVMWFRATAAPGA